MSKVSSTGDGKRKKVGSITTMTDQDPMSVFRYALRSRESQRQYPGRFKVFLDYLGLKGTTEDQAREFAKMVRHDPKWFQGSFMRFIVYQKERVNRKEISEGTIGNYYKAVKLFCEMNFDQAIINWKRIARGLPRGRKFALDRIPRIEEIRKLCEYPDRGIKPTVYTMVSSGIRIGAFDYLQWKHITPIMNSKGEVIAAKLIIYPGDPIEQYYTFCSPEACMPEDDRIRIFTDRKNDSNNPPKGYEWKVFALDTDPDIWLFLENEKEIIFGIKDWKVYRRAAESIKEIPVKSTESDSGSYDNRGLQDYWHP